MEGNGSYTFPTGTQYEGAMNDGMFHGKGTLLFPNGYKYEAMWENGSALEASLIRSVNITIMEMLSKC